MALIEWIKSGDQVIAIIIRGKYSPEETTFITPDDYLQQVGFVVYEADGVIPPHTHKPLERQIVGTAETLVLVEGKVEVELFDDELLLREERVLEKGDILILVSGGHGFRMLEDSVFLEVKQGPYTGLVEKEHF